MQKHILFSTPLFESSYQNSLTPIIKDCKDLAKLKDFSVVKSNNRGYQSQDNLHTYEFMQPLMQWICEEAGDVFAELGIVRKELTIENCWFNINHSLNSHNQMHLHTGIVSGVFYLQAPEGSGNINFISSGMNQLWRGHMESAGRRNEHNSYTFTINPTPGQLYLWPSHVYHSVDTNSIDVERMSIGFNLF